MRPPERGIGRGEVAAATVWCQPLPLGVAAPPLHLTLSKGWCVCEDGDVVVNWGGGGRVGVG